MRLWKAMSASLLMIAVNGGAVALANDETPDNEAIERGRYLVTVSGCNDCHTAGYTERNGAVPQSEWLTGSPIGFQGPWGTTYPTNLRLVAQSVSREQWVERARNATRPPMPWFNLRNMTDADLLAMYDFIRSLGPKGEPAPAFVPPGQQAATPYFEFVPKNLPKQAQANK